MRIAIDCRLWSEGGVGRYIRNLVYYLSKLDRKNDYTLFFWNKVPQGLTAPFEVKTTTAHWHSFSEQWQLLRDLERGQFSLVHFPYFSHPILYNRPFVITIHDLTIWHFKTGKATTKNPLFYNLKRFGYRQALVHGVKRAKHLLVPSEFVKADISRTFALGGDKITVTPEGVGYEMSEAKAEKVESVKRPFWLYVGNFYPHKNVEFLLESFKKHNSKEALLVLCGPNDFFAYRVQKRAADLGLTPQVQFLPQASEGELRWLYKNALGLVLPSLFEGFGLPLVEAVANNCPLLLADIPVFREIAPQGAVFFDPRDKESLRKGFQTKIKMAKVDKNYFNRFSFENMAKQTLAVYENAG